MENISDLLIRDYVKELGELLDRCDAQSEDEFECGRRCGLNEAASLLVNEARTFGADFEKIGLATFATRPDID